MAIFSVAVRTSNATSTSAAGEIIASTTNAFRLLEFGLTINAATASVYGYGSPAVKGVTPATSSTAQAEDAGNTTTGQTTINLTWATSPTIPTNFLRRVSLPATIGAGIVWTFPRGRVVLKSITDVLWPIVTGSVADVWFVVDE